MKSNQTELKTAVERVTAIYAKKPSLAKMTDVSTTRLEQGLTCKWSDGDWSSTTDMPGEYGGNGSAPSPGVYIRASIGSCLAIGYAMWAARLDVTFRSIEVKIETDIDSGGFLGTNDSDAGYSDLRYNVLIDSDAPKEKITEIIEAADAQSPLLDVFRRPVNCTRSISFTENNKATAETHL